MDKQFSIKKIFKILMISVIALIYISFVVALSFGSLTAAILTIIPAEASKPNYLGYYSTCAFVPFSTLILSIMSFIGFILLIKLVSFLKRRYRSSKVPLEINKITN